MPVFVLFAAHTTDTPVWWLFAATAALVGVTAVLAAAALTALRQLRVAVDQLDEVRRDRHVQVFSDLGRRWEGPEMTEALVRESDYTPTSLAALFARPPIEPSHNPIREHRRALEDRDRVVLLRVPNYFEDAAMIAKAGGLEARLFRDNFGGVAVDEWKLWAPAIKTLQKADPDSYVEFERLATAVEAEDQARLQEPNEAALPPS
jgi:hypothetical protein